MFPNPYPPKMLAAMLGLKGQHEAVRKACQRMEGVWLYRERCGQYRAWADHRLLKNIHLEPYRVHGLQFLLKSPTGGSPPALRGLGTEVRTRDGQHMRKAEFLGRLVTVQEPGVGAHGCLVSIGADRAPFSVPEFAELAAWLEGLAGGGRVDVLSMELNIDTEDHRLRISGASVISLQTARAGLWKAYHKKVLKATRIEACLHRLDMRLEEVTRVLEEFSREPVDLPVPPSSGMEVV